MGIFFVPTELVNGINKVKSVESNWVSHTPPNFPCFQDWEKFFLTYLKKLPAGFTGNYVFEFHKAELTTKHLITDSQEEAVTHRLLCKYYEKKNKDMWVEIFGAVKLKELTINHVNLPCLPSRSLDN